MKVLVAGIGNTFLSDDGFGVEVVARLRGRELPAHVELVDTGIRGMHLAYQLLDGYDVLVLVDAVARGSDPGTLYVLEHDLDAPQRAPRSTRTAWTRRRCSRSSTGWPPRWASRVRWAGCSWSAASPPRSTRAWGCRPPSRRRSGPPPTP